MAEQNQEQVYYAQCLGGHVWTIARGSELEERAKKHKFLDAICVSCDDCEQCKEEYELMKWGFL